MLGMSVDLRILADLGDRIEWHDSLGSTNDRARELALEKEGIEHGFVVGTEEQEIRFSQKGVSV